MFISEKYNYIYYGVSSDWFKNMLADLNVYEDVALHEDPYRSRIGFLNLLYKAHTYPYAEKYFNLPLKGVWNSHIKVDSFAKQRPLCFIFTPKYAMNVGLLRYLRETYENCRLVVMFRDILKNEYDWYPGFDIEIIKKEFDLVMAYNKFDCEKYGLINFIDEAPQKLNFQKSEFYPESDVFCAIADKGRVDIALSFYDKFVEDGYKPFFYIQAKKSVGEEREGVIYSKKMMPYDEYIRHMINSRCVLEIVQDGTTCFTNRAKEAIIYNKKLITNCPFIKEQRFYSSKNIVYVSNPQEMDASFIDDDGDVDYGYDDDYSAVKLLKFIDSLLT